MSWARRSRGSRRRRSRHAGRAGLAGARGDLEDLGAVVLVQGELAAADHGDLGLVVAVVVEHRRPVAVAAADRRAPQLRAVGVIDAVLDDDLLVTVLVEVAGDRPVVGDRRVGRGLPDEAAVLAVEHVLVGEHLGVAVGVEVGHGEEIVGGRGALGARPDLGAVGVERDDLAAAGDGDDVGHAVGVDVRQGADGVALIARGRPVLAARGAVEHDEATRGGDVDDVGGVVLVDVAVAVVVGEVGDEAHVVGALFGALPLDLDVPGVGHRGGGGALTLLGDAHDVPGSASSTAQSGGSGTSVSITWVSMGSSVSLQSGICGGQSGGAVSTSGTPAASSLGLMVGLDARGHQDREGEESGVAHGDLEEADTPAYASNGGV
jgi:hypothetical protein